MARRLIHTMVLTVGLYPLCLAIADDPPATQPTSQPHALVTEDFESERPLNRDWDTHGEIGITRVDAESDGSVAGVGGKAMLVQASAKSRLERKRFDHPMRYENLQEMVLRINAISASKDTPVGIDVRFIARGRVAWRATTLYITQPGWREYHISTRHCASAGVGYCDWNDVNRIGFYFRRMGAVAIDGIELIRGANNNAAELPVPQLAAMAFGADRPFLRWDLRPFVVLSDNQQLTPKLQDALDQLAARIKADWPQAQAPRRPVPLVIFAHESDYHAFWPRVAEWYGGDALAAPTSDGFTAYGIGSGFCLPDSTDVRPVWIHEAAHALLAPTLQLDANGSWLHEGLATYYQLAIAGQDLGPLVRPGLENVAARLPMKELVSGDPIDPAHYWQAAMLMSFFLDQPHWREGLDRALVTMRKLGTVDLRPISRPALRTPVPGLEKHLLEWAKKQFAE